MNLPALIDYLRVKGLSDTDVLEAVKIVSPGPSKPSARQERNARYYATHKDRLNKTHSDAFKTLKKAVKVDGSNGPPNPKHRLILAGCSGSLLSDWSKARKGKAITHTVVDGLEREAAAAGMTIPQAVQMCAERGWQGFRAEFVKNNHHGRANAPSGYTGLLIELEGVRQ